MQQDQVDQFLEKVKTDIPLVSHMGLERIVFADGVIRFNVSLAPNLNDKGTGFGGAISGLCTLAGWVLTTLLLKAEGLERSAVVKTGTIDFFAPVTSDFSVHCYCPEPDGEEILISKVRKKGRGRLPIVAEIFQGETLAVRYRGDYVALDQ